MHTYYTVNFLFDIFSAWHATLGAYKLTNNSLLLYTRIHDMNISIVKPTIAHIVDVRSKSSFRFIFKIMTRFS